MLVELQCAIFLGIALTLAAWIIVSNVNVSCPGTFSLDHRSEASLPPAAGQMYSHKERAHKLQIKQNAINRAYIYIYIYNHIVFKIIAIYILYDYIRMYIYSVCVCVCWCGSM